MHRSNSHPLQCTQCAQKHRTCCHSRPCSSSPRSLHPTSPLPVCGTFYGEQALQLAARWGSHTELSPAHLERLVQATTALANSGNVVILAQAKDEETLGAIVAHLNKLEGGGRRPRTRLFVQERLRSVGNTCYGGLRESISRKIQGRSRLSQGGNPVPDSGQIPNFGRETQRAPPGVRPTRRWPAPSKTSRRTWWCALTNSR